MRAMIPGLRPQCCGRYRDAGIPRMRAEDAHSTLITESEGGQLMPTTAHEGAVEVGAIPLEAEGLSGGTRPVKGTGEEIDPRKGCESIPTSHHSRKVTRPAPLCAAAEHQLIANCAVKIII